EIVRGHGFLPRLAPPSYGAAASFFDAPRCVPSAAGYRSIAGIALAPRITRSQGLMSRIEREPTDAVKRPSAGALSVLAGRTRLPVRASERGRRLTLRLRDTRAGLRGLVPILRRTRRAAFHDVPDLLLVDRFVLHQGLRHHVELRLVLLQQRLRFVVRRVDQLADLLVDRV